MSRNGCCYDNAVAEMFFWSLKHEWIKFESYENLDDAKISVFKYIETFYNLVHLH
jgi:putative transposase